MYNYIFKYFNRYVGNELELVDNIEDAFICFSYVDIFETLKVECKNKNLNIEVIEIKNVRN